MKASELGLIVRYVCFDCGYSEDVDAPNTHKCSKKGTQMSKVTKNDSAFYTNEAGSEVVWEEEGCEYYVVRAGEMRIHAVSESGDEVVIRYTDQLEDFGIKNDQQLSEWSDKGEEVFSWVNNSWFEIYTEKDPDFFSEPLHDLEEAIAQAKELQSNPTEEEK